MVGLDEGVEINFEKPESQVATIGKGEPNRGKDGPHLGHCGEECRAEAIAWPAF